MSELRVVSRKVTNKTCTHKVQWIVTPDGKARLQVSSANGIKVTTSSTNVRWCVECGAFYTGDVWMTPSRNTP